MGLDIAAPQYLGQHHWRWAAASVVVPAAASVVVLAAASVAVVAAAADLDRRLVAPAEAGLTAADSALASVV